MAEAENKAVEQRMVAEALNRGNLKTVEECLNPDFVYHGPGGAEVKGIEGYQRFLSSLRAYYPDMRVTIEDIIAEGSLVATRTRCVFTSKGRAITLPGSILDRFKDGKISETWEQYDRLDLYQQLGIIPQKSGK